MVNVTYNIFGCLMVLYLCDLVQLAPTNQTEEVSTSTKRQLTREEMKKIGKTCMLETGVRIETILRAIKEDIPKNDEKYKSYLVCSYKKQGYLSEDGGTMLYDNLYSFLQESAGYAKEDLHYIDDCKTITAETPGDLCLKNLVCILDGLHKVEKNREIDTNTIES